MYLPVPNLCPPAYGLGLDRRGNSNTEGIREQLRSVPPTDLRRAAHVTTCMISGVPTSHIESKNKSVKLVLIIYFIWPNTHRKPNRFNT